MKSIGCVILLMMSQSGKRAMDLLNSGNLALGSMIASVVDDQAERQQDNV